MAVVPGFKYDLFVSYAHRNDVPWGWVTDFIQTLKAELEGKGRDFRIWWDPGLRTGEDFNVAIANAISESAVFLSVLSLAYGESSYCRQEVEEFRQQRHPAFGILVGSMSRMQGIVIEREFTRDRWVPELRSTSPQPFFDDTSPLFARPAKLVSSDPWIQGLWRVRDSIWTALQEMRAQKESGAVVEQNYGTQPTRVPRMPSLYIADVTDDLYNKRERLCTALEQAKDFQVSRWATCEAPPVADPGDLSVHLFSAVSGHGYQGSKRCLPQLQFEAFLAAQPARRPVVWLPRNIDLSDVDADEYRAFLESLQQSNAIELLRSDFEDLKDELAKRMHIRRASQQKSVREIKDGPLIHIWHVASDMNRLTPLKEYLKKEYSCAVSTFEYYKDQPQSKLAVCDGLIVSFDPETRTWAEDVITEAFRLRRREERPTAMAAIELPPAMDTEFNFEHPRVFPVFVRQPEDLEQMGHFLALLQADA